MAAPLAAAAPAPIVLHSLDEAFHLAEAVAAGSAGGAGAAAAAAVPPQLPQLADALERLQRRERDGAVLLAPPALPGAPEPLAFVEWRAPAALVGLHVLIARIIAHPAPADRAALVPFIDSLLRLADGNVLRHAAARVDQFSHLLHAVAETLQDPRWLLPRLRSLFQLCPYGTRHDVLTPLHAMLLYESLRSGNYGAGEEVLQINIKYTPSHASPIRYADVLQYLYYGALLLLKLQQYERAHEFLELCLCAPAQHVSAIQLDAYKKRLLLQLLLHGKTTPLPKHIAPAVARALRTPSSGMAGSLEAYEQLARVYARRPALNLQAALRSPGSAADKVDRAQEELAQLVVDHRQVFEQDANACFVDKLVHLYPMRRIQRLQDTLSAVSLRDAAALLGLGGEDAVAELQGSLREMVRLRWINASVAPCPGAEEQPGKAILTFEAPAEQYRTADAMRRLEQLALELQHSNELVERRERAAARSSRFLSKAQAARQQGFGGFGSIDLDDFDE